MHLQWFLPLRKLMCLTLSCLNRSPPILTCTCKCTTQMVHLDWPLVPAQAALRSTTMVSGGLSVMTCLDKPRLTLRVVSWALNQHLPMETSMTWGMWPASTLYIATCTVRYSCSCLSRMRMWHVHMTHENTIVGWWATVRVHNAWIDYTQSTTEWTINQTNNSESRTIMTMIL